MAKTGSFSAVAHENNELRNEMQQLREAAEERIARLDSATKALNGALGELQRRMDRLEQAQAQAETRQRHDSAGLTCPGCGQSASSGQHSIACFATGF